MFAYVDEFKVPCEGMRALVHFAASIQDRVALAGGAIPLEGKKIDRRSDLLTSFDQRL